MMPSEQLLRSRSHTCTFFDLVTPILYNQKDNYGRRYGPLNPLTFDRANESKRINSSSTLFKLPVKTLAIILQHIPSGPSLSNFAVASRDCCVLARSRLFIEVTLDYGPRSFSLLQAILNEVCERRNGGSKKLLSNTSNFVRDEWMSHLTLLSVRGNTRENQNGKFKPLTSASVGTLCVPISRSQPKGKAWSEIACSPFVPIHSKF